MGYSDTEPGCDCVGSTQDLLPVLFIEGAIQTSKGGKLKVQTEFYISL
jgi:hypothetical protein